MDLPVALKPLLLHLLELLPAAPPLLLLPDFRESEELEPDELGELLDEPSELPDEPDELLDEPGEPDELDDCPCAASTRHAVQNAIPAMNCFLIYHPFVFCLVAR